MDFTLFLNWLAGQVGVSPATLLMLVALVVSISNLLGRVIPDDATGFLGVVRKAAKVIGLYLSNRVSSNTTVNDVAKAAVGVVAKGEVIDKMIQAGTLPPDNGLVLGRDASTGRFTAVKQQTSSPAIVGLLALLLMLAMLPGCVTMQAGIKTVGTVACNNQGQVRLAAQLALVKADNIADFTQRTLAIQAANTTLALLNSCPTAGK